MFSSSTRIGRSLFFSKELPYCPSHWREVSPPKKVKKKLPPQRYLETNKTYAIAFTFFISTHGRKYNDLCPAHIFGQAIFCDGVSRGIFILITDPASLLARRRKLWTGRTGSCVLNFSVHVFFDRIAVLGIQTCTAPMPRSTHSDQSVEHGTHY